MIIRSKLISAVSTEPITLARAKSHLRVDIDAEDNLISSLIVVAREQAEQETRRRYGMQTWEITFDDHGPFLLKSSGNVSSVTIEKRLADGSWSNVEASQYKLVQSLPAEIVFDRGFEFEESYLEPEKIKVTVACGEEPQESVKIWMLIRLTALYENRETDSIDYSTRLIDSQRLKTF